MHRLLPILLVAGAAVAAGADDAVRLSEPVHSTSTHETFGSRLPDGSARSLSEAVAGMRRGEAGPVLIETEVVRVCQRKGCFFIARDGDVAARVAFKDYGFFIPSDAAGKRVTVAGTLERVEVSAEQAAHFAADAGRDPGQASAGFEVRVTATGVRIPRG